MLVLRDEEKHNNGFTMHWLPAEEGRWKREGEDMNVKRKLKGRVRKRHVRIEEKWKEHSYVKKIKTFWDSACFLKYFLKCIFNVTFNNAAALCVVEVEQVPHTEGRILNAAVLGSIAVPKTCMFSSLLSTYFLSVYSTKGLYNQYGFRNCCKFKPQI